MTKFIIAFCTLFFLQMANGAPEQSRPQSLGEALFPPELIMQHADELGLDDAQKEAIRSAFEKLREQFPELQEKLQKETGALAELMGQDSIDQKKAIAQLDKVLDAEREIKHAQVSLMLTVREKLKPEQIKKLNELKEKMGAENRARNPGQGVPPQAAALQAKLQQIRERATRLHDGGKDMSGVKSIMDELPPLIQGQKFKEAEAVADRALKALDEAEKK